MPENKKTEKRLRISFDAKTEVFRRAVYIAAAMQNKTHNEILNELIKEYLSEYIHLAEKAIEDDEPRPRKRKESD